MLNDRTVDLNPSNTTLAEMGREFRRMRRGAEFRGSQWLLTLDEFIEVWGNQWRDKRRLNLVLCRNGYKGPWAIGNVRIDTRANQVRDQHDRRREVNYGGYVYHPKTRKEFD
jgi:hypothetical protein